MEFFIAGLLFLVAVIIASHHFMITVPARKVREEKERLARLRKNEQDRKQRLAAIAADSWCQVAAANNIDSQRKSAQAKFSTGSNKPIQSQFRNSRSTQGGNSNRNNDDMLNPMNLASPLNPIYHQPSYDSRPYEAPSRSDSDDCGSRSHGSHDHSHSSHSSSSDHGSSYSCDSGSSSSSSSGSDW